MNTYIAIVFSNEVKAQSALRLLWNMDEDGDLTVHGAALVRRDDMGHIRVADRHSDLGMRTAIGVGVGALLGLLAGPVGIAAAVAGAAAMSVGAATAVGALAGGTVGAAADVVTEDSRETAAFETFFALQPGQSAVVAEISEDRTSVLDEVMRPMGGVVHRRTNNAANTSAFGPGYYNDYLFPYYYEPVYA